MKWVGLTGGLGTGKSTVSRLLMSHGIPVLDADRVAKQVIEPGTPGYDQVVQVFGPDLKAADGSLDRVKLAQRVFGVPSELEKLERIIHPLVQAEIRHQKQWLEDQGTLWAVYDVPLLFEKNLMGQFDYIIVVTTTPEQQMERVKARNGWNEDEIKKRLASQKPLKDKELGAHHVLQNNADLPQLEKKVETLVQMLNHKFNREDS